VTTLTLVTKAYHHAAIWHAGHRRKGEAAEPYINHLTEVADLIATATQGTDLNLVAAAVLHDAIEDAGVARDQMTQIFNEDVATLVAEVTDDKSLPKAERKRLQVERTPHKSPRAKMIKIADKTSNLRSITETPPTDWPLERKVEYLEWARTVAQGAKGQNVLLDEAFDAAALELQRHLEGN